MPYPARSAPDVIAAAVRLEACSEEWRRQTRRLAGIGFSPALRGRCAVALEAARRELVGELDALGREVELASGALRQQARAQPPGVA